MLSDNDCDYNPLETDPKVLHLNIILFLYDNEKSYHNVENHSFFAGVLSKMNYVKKS